MDFGEIEPSGWRGGESRTPAPASEVRFNRRELDRILGLYGRMVAAGEWRDYAIDFLNPAPDFERDRITEFYFEMVVDKMARLVIERALNGAASNPWPRWEEMLGVGAASGVIGAPKGAAQVATASVSTSVPAASAGDAGAKSK